ncbi:MAG: hypothetical protein OJI70_08580 [Zavarzinia sp.]|nr:hypothetical protein [Zavarzinia sp.]
MTGGLGDDSYIVDDVGDVVTEDAGEGRDTVTTSVSYTLAPTTEIERFVAAAGLSAIDLTGNDFASQIYGNDGANIIIGGGGGDSLYGRAGDDTLTGGADDDLLDGGAGADAMTGGAGNDIYAVDDAGDTVTELTGGGTDRITASVSFALGLSSEVEQLYSRGADTIDLSGSDTDNTIVANDVANVLSGFGGNDRITARGGDDTLLGGDGDDVLIGGAGADAMTGGAGDDTFYVDDAGDTVTEATGEGSDKVYVETSWTLGAGQAVESLYLRGTGAIDVTGNDLANTIYGNSGANVLSGGAGADTIHGSGGDTLDGGADSDSYIVTAGGSGTIRVLGDSSDTLSSSDTGWVSTGVVMLDGLGVATYANGGTDLFADTGIDLAGLQADAMFGTATVQRGQTRQVIDTTTLSTARGFVIQGVASGDNTGASVSSAGDINGDGYDDIVVGVPYGSATYNGEAYVVFGKATGFGTVDGTGRLVLDLASLAPADGFLIQGDAPHDLLGTSVSWAGDVNGDGYDDLVVGAKLGDDGGNVAGEAYVIFGGATAFGAVDGTGRAVIDLAALSAAEGFIIQGDAAYDVAGYSVSNAGDINGDGFDDLIVSAKSGDDGGYSAGEAYVVFGTDLGFGTADGAGRQVIDLTGLTAAQGFIVQGDTAEDQLGQSVHAAGDVNGDGFDDIIVGAPKGDDGGDRAGEAYVIFGGAGGFGSPDGASRQVIDTTTLSASQGFIIQGDHAVSQTGWSVASLGDINGDGFDDMAVSTFAETVTAYYAGAAFVVYGTDQGFGTDVGGRQVLDLGGLTASQGFIISANYSYEYLGSAVSGAGDVNGDGIDDIIVASRNNGDAGSNTGAAYVVFGTTEGFGIDEGGRQVIFVGSLGADEGFVIQGDEVDDHLSLGISAAGDINGDGFDDLIVGAPNGDDAGSEAGEAYVIFGGPEGFTLGQVAGDDTDNILTGTSAAERLVGGRGNDTLVGGGGADVFLGGSGDDIIDVGSGNLFRVYGGTGNDTLKIAASFDLADLASFVHDVEVIDLTGGGAQTVVANAVDILAMGAANRDALGDSLDNVLVIEGDASDLLGLANLGGAVTTIGFGGVDYDLYAFNGRIVLAVDTDIQILV